MRTGACTRKRRSDAVTAVALVLALLLLPACGPKSPPGVPSGAKELYQEPEPSIREVTLGPGDEIEVSVWRNPDLDGKYVVNANGDLMLPLIGTIHADDMGVFALREHVVDSLTRYLKDPQVTLTVIASRSRKFYVLGEVQKPGIFNLGDERVPLVEAIARAGGFTLDAKRTQVLLVHGGLEQNNLEMYDVKRLFKHGDVSQNPLVAKGDIIYVPSSNIANVDRFFQHMQTILWPILTLERILVLAPLAKRAITDGLTQDVIVVEPN